MQLKTVISVAIPSYNLEKYIEQTILSAINQITDFNFEVVIGDDNSTDSTKYILLDLQKKFPDKIKLFFNEKNVGLLRNLNNIYKVCSGKYIALLGGDDLFSDQTKLQKMVNFFKANHEYGIAHSDAYVLHEGGLDTESYIAEKTLHQNPEIKIVSGEIYEFLLDRNFMLASTVCFDRELYVKHVNLDEYYEKGFLMEDTPSWIELSRYTKIGYINEPLITYRLRKNSLSHTKSISKNYEFINSSYKVRFHFIDKYGCSDSLRMKILTRFHYFNLRYAYLMHDKQLSKKAYDFLINESNEKKTFDCYLFYYCTKFEFLWNLTTFLKNIKEKHLPKVSIRKIIKGRLREW